MKPELITVLIFFAAVKLIAQERSSAPKPVDQIDTFYPKANAYKRKIKKHVAFVDTVLNNKDSIVVRYYSKTNKVLKETVSYVNDTGCLNKTKEIYLTNSKLVEYCETWEYDCLTVSEGDWNGILTLYERYVYDKESRVIRKVIMGNSTVGVWRYDYKYESPNSTKVFSQKINRSLFWE